MNIFRAPNETVLVLWLGHEPSYIFIIPTLIVIKIHANLNKIMETSKFEINTTTNSSCSNPILF